MGADFDSSSPLLQCRRRADRPFQVVDSGKTAGRLTLHARISDSQWLQGRLSLQLFWVAVGGGWRGMGPNGNAPRAAERLCAVECCRGCARTGLASQGLRLVAGSCRWLETVWGFRGKTEWCRRRRNVRYSVHQHSTHATAMCDINTAGQRIHQELCADWARPRFVWICFSSLHSNVTGCA